MAISQLEKLRTDISDAAATINALGVMIPAVFISIANWFYNVEVYQLRPIPVLPITDDERSNLLRTAINEMLAAIQDVSARGLTDELAFQQLAPIVDPLWRELYSLHAPTLNASWESTLPTSDDERQDRVAQLEQATGLSRQQFLAQSKGNMGLRVLLCRFGLTDSDLL